MTCPHFLAPREREEKPTKSLIDVLFTNCGWGFKKRSMRNTPPLELVEKRLGGRIFPKLLPPKPNPLIVHVSPCETLVGGIEADISRNLPRLNWLAREVSDLVSRFFVHLSMDWMGVVRVER